MAAGTILANCCLMDIDVAIDTFSPCFRKNQGWMTKPAVYANMLPNQRQFGGIMIEGVNFLIQLPTGGTVTVAATDFKVGTVRRVAFPACQEQQYANYQE